MAALTLSQMASRVLRNVQMPENSSTTSVQALADVKQFINERAKDIWNRRMWREYIIRGTATIAAGTRFIALSDITLASGYPASGNGLRAAFAEIAQVYNSDGQPLVAVDPMSTNNIQADVWTDTSEPSAYYNRGQKGIELLGQYAASETLTFIGKADYQDLTDSESWIFGVEGEQALICGGSYEFLRWHEEDDQRAQLALAEYESWVLKLIENHLIQGADQKQVIPLVPWTSGISPGGEGTSVTGADSAYW